MVPWSGLQTEEQTVAWQKAGQEQAKQKSLNKRAGPVVIAWHADILTGRHHAKHKR